MNEQAFTALEQNQRIGLSVPSAIKAQWIAALRSGKYKQGKGRLKNDEGSEVTYCCLGVLEEVVAGEVERNAGNSRYRAFPSKEWCDKHDIKPGRYFGGLGNSVVSEIRSNFEPYITATATASNYGIKVGSIVGAATANDAANMTFEQIADALERDLPAH